MEYREVVDGGIDTQAVIQNQNDFCPCTLVVLFQLSY